MTTGVEHIITALIESSETDLNTSRQLLSVQLWQTFWCRTFAKAPFSRTLNPAFDDGKESVGNNQPWKKIGPSISCDATDPPRTYRWDLLEFPPSAPCPGSIGERHDECMLIWRSLGPDLYGRVVEKTYTASFAALIDEVAALEGLDVFWSGHAIVNGQEGQIPIAAPSTSSTRFGALRVCRFPFTAEFRFDDVPEGTVFSLASSLADDAFELLVADLQQLLDENRSQQIVLKRNVRRSLRCLSADHALVQLTIKRRFGSATLSGTLSVTSKNSSKDDDDLVLEPGFQVDLLKTTVVGTRGLICTCLLPTGDLPLYRLLAGQQHQAALLDLQSKEIISMIESIPDRQLNQFTAKLDTIKAKTKALYKARIELLDFSFYTDVFANADLTLDRLHGLINDKYANLTTLFTDDEHVHDLVSYRTAIAYLDRCSKPEVYWYSFWMQILESDLGWISSSSLCDPKNLDSVLYKCSQIRSPDDLERMGFAPSILQSDVFIGFWTHLELIRSKVFYKNINYLNEAITSVRLELGRCGLSPDRISKFGLGRIPGSQPSLDIKPEPVNANISAIDNTELDDTLNDIVVQGFFEPEGSSDDEFQKEHQEREGSDKDDGLKSGNQRKSGLVPARAESQRSSLRSPKRTRSLKRINDSARSSISDFDHVKMKFVMNRVKSLSTAAGSRSDSILSQNNDNPFLRSMHALTELDIVQEEDQRSDIWAKIDVGKTGEGQSNAEKGGSDNDWKSDGSSMSESSSDSDDGRFRYAESDYKLADHLKIDHDHDGGPIAVGARQRSLSQGKTLLSSPVARVHQLEMRRRSRKRSVLETIMDVVVPQCGPGRS